MYLDPGMVESGKRDLLSRMKYYIPSGCDECGGSGFSGMTAIFDMVVFTPSVRMEMLMDKREEEKREKILSHFRLGLDLIREKSEGG
jgi:type II secretory ATPase GspE/PulE/Tfp pilus assembly ATPase PilB-like protein